MANNPYLEQAKKNVIGLIKDKKFKTAYNFCKEILVRFPEAKEFVRLQEDIEKEVEKQNTVVVENAIKELEPLWSSKKYFEILKQLKSSFQLAPENRVLIKTYEKAQKLYKEQMEDQEKEFGKKEENKLEELFKKDPDKLVRELNLIDQRYPKNKKFQELTQSYRNKIIKKKIDEKSELFNSNKFEDISNFLGQLRSIDRNSSEVVRLEREMKDKFDQNKIDKKTEFLYQTGDQIVTLLKLEKYDKAMKAAQEILDVDPENKKIQKLLKKAEKAHFKQSREKSIDCITENFDALEKEYKKNKKNFVRI